MSEKALLHWLQQFLSGDGHTAVSFEELSPDEVLVARRLEKDFRKGDCLQEYSNAFLQTLDSTGKFSEIAIRSLSALTKIGCLGETVRDINTFCKHIAEIFTQELEFESCSILLKATDDGLSPAATSMRGDKYSSTGKKKTKTGPLVGKDIALRVASTGEYVFIPDFGVTCLLSVPIRSGDGIVGVVNCCHPLPETFDENKINLIILISNFAGQIMTLITLHNRISAWNEALREEVQKKTLELRGKNAKLHKLAVTDSLTNLYNRRFFFTRLEEEFSRTLRYDEQFALMSIDLDNLKAINDVYGHVVGDVVIRRIAKCLKSSVRKGDVVGRLGGDEFGYIMLGASEEVAFQFALRLQASLAGVVFKGLEKKPTMSIGIAAAGSEKFKKYQDVYQAADSALYIAKKKRNSVSLYGKTTTRR
ncbi:MAG: sensor domain-containing diguanylate cyclase [Nitrospirae bacterium]|nr:sensor domain-containing diguanylate cyclase [Nitrospirota bacterium]